jgi:hypothetical protein
MKRMKRWESVEAYIEHNVAAGAAFTSLQYAAANGLSGAEASEHIQAYLTAQRASRSRTKYVLHRQPGTRTKNAHWTVGVKSKDVRLLGLGFADDVKTKWMLAVEPDIRRIATVNPSAARRAEKVCDATFDGALAVLEAAVRA